MHRDLTSLQDVRDARPARSRARTGGWPASSATTRLGEHRPSTLRAGGRPESRGRSQAPQRAVLRFSGRGPSPASRENLLRHLAHGLFCSHERAILLLRLLLVAGRRDVVVTPGRAFEISGFIALVLSCPLPGIAEPGVGEIVRQRAFALPD